MSTPSDPSGPQPPPASGYEAHRPTPTPEASSYLADTYPAAGFPPPPVAPVHDRPSPLPAQAWADGPTTTAYPGADPYGAPAYGQQPYGSPGYGTPQAYGPPQGYGAPQPYGYPAWEQGWQPPPTDLYCVWALVCGLVGLFGLYITAPVGIWLGVVGLRRTARDGTQGRGMAIAGIVTGAIGTVVLLLVVAFFGFIVSTASYS